MKVQMEHNQISVAFVYVECSPGHHPTNLTAEFEIRREGKARMCCLLRKLTKILS